MHSFKQAHRQPNTSMSNKSRHGNFISRLLGVLLLSAAISGSCFAAGSVSGRIVDIRIDQDGRGMAIFDVVINNSPTCIHPSYTRGLSFDTRTAGGKSIYAFALTAKTTGTHVDAYGLGTCTIYGGAWVEDWNYGHLR